MPMVQLHQERRRQVLFLQPKQRGRMAMFSTFWNGRQCYHCPYENRPPLSLPHGSTTSLMLQHGIADHNSNEEKDAFHDDAAAVTAAAGSLSLSLTTPTEAAAAAESETRSMVKEISALALPSLGGMLIDPLMSLVDTACVGQVSFVQVAAMAPCTSIYQFIFLACLFLSATTTNLVASNPYNLQHKHLTAKKNATLTIDTMNATTTTTAVDDIASTASHVLLQQRDNHPAVTTTTTGTATALPEQVPTLHRLRDDYNERVVSSACILALGLGTMLAILLVMFAHPLLIAAGCPATTILAGESMMFHAKRYLLIRAAGLPFVLVATVLQGASLACHDAWTPLRIFAVAGLLNVVGDVVLTMHCHLGATGAALATTGAQAAAALYYVYRQSSLRLFRRRSTSNTRKNNRKKDSDEIKKNARTRQQQQKQPRGVRLAWKGPPSRQMIRAFWPVALSVLLRECGNMTAYSLLTRTAAGMGATVLAAHQVTLQVWWLLSYIPEPNVIAGQALIARDINTRPGRVPKLVKLLFAVTLGMGIAVAALTGLVLMLPMLARTIVADASVRALLRQSAPYAVLAQITCCVGEIAGGICVGSGDLKHLPASAIGATCALAAALRFSANVSDIWLCSNIFFVVRFLGFLLPSPKTRRLLLSRKR